MIAFVGGFFLDLIMGDPYNFPHPVRWIGRLISDIEKHDLGEEDTKALSGEQKRRCGRRLVLLVCGTTILVTAFVLLLAYGIHPMAGCLVEMFLTYQTLALRCLCKESKKVYICLRDKTLEDARYAVSMIVGRDTQNLSPTGVAKAAIESGVARKTITDWDAYKKNLMVLLGQETKLTRNLHNTARMHPQRIVFAEGAHPSMMKAAVQAKTEGICFPILLGNPDRLRRVAERLKLNLDGIELIDMRADQEQGRRATYAKHLAKKRARQGYTFEEAYDKMYERNYFGMMMVETGDADAFITGLYTKYSNTIKVAKEVIGIRKEYNTFATMHILNTSKGVFYLADTLINRHPDKSVLVDIAKLTAHTVKFFNEEPRMAMISYSNFGTDEVGSPVCVHEAVEQLQNQYPDLIIDGEMQVNFALNKELRDDKYPFTRLKGKDVNTLVFPNMSSAQASYKLLQAIDPDAEIIGPIQMGLNKPIHFTDFESSVRDIVNITAVAAIDAYVDKIKKQDTI